MQRWIDFALKLADESLHTKHKMAAVLVRGGRVLAASTNGHRPGDHAEKRAIRRTKYPGGSTIIIVREGKLMSKPCLLCKARILEAGITRIVYLDWNSQIQMEDK